MTFLRVNLKIPEAGSFEFCFNNVHNPSSIFYQFITKKRMKFELFSTPKIYESLKFFAHAIVPESIFPLKKHIW